MITWYGGINRPSPQAAKPAEKVSVSKGAVVGMVAGGIVFIGCVVGAIVITIRRNSGWFSLTIRTLCLLFKIMRFAYSH